MKAAKIALLLIALIALAGVFVWNYQQRNDPVRLIASAASGSLPALEQLESMALAGQLDQHSDAIGFAAIEYAAGNPTVFDTEDPILNRWHELYFRTDPLRNSSEQTRINFVRSTLRFEPVVPDSVIPGHKQGVGLSVGGSMRSDNLDDLGRYKLVVSISTVLADDREIWPEGLGSTSKSMLADLGNSFSSSATHLPIAPDDTDPTGTIPITVRFKWSVLDEATDPPTEFATWTEEIVATRPLTPPPPSPSRTIGPVEVPPGKIEFGKVQSLLDKAATGDESAMEELITLGRTGELRPYANELGSRLSQALRADWRPRMAAYFDEHGWESDRPGAHPLPTPDDQSALLIGLFYLAEPVSTATRDTWLEVATAGVYAHHRIALDDAESSDARLLIKIVTALVQPTSLTQVSGISFSMETLDFDGQSWPLRMSSTQRITSMTQPPSHWRSHMTKVVHRLEDAHMLSKDMASRLSERAGLTINDLQTHVVLRLLHSEQTTLATWPVTIDTPITPDPLDETTPDHR